jgi:hypothetical protein
VTSTPDRPTWRDRAPKYDPNDIRFMLSHSASSSGHGARVHLEAEMAADGRPLFMIEMKPEQFASLMSSRSTVLPSLIPVAPGRVGGQRCPDPSSHDCDATGSRDTCGDCDGQTGMYRVEEAGTYGFPVGRAINLCDQHALSAGTRVSGPLSGQKW